MRPFSSPAKENFREHCPACARLGKPAGDLTSTRANIPISGILNLDKPPGLTSHDVVARIRRAAKIRRVGHAGTLDPMATGVLLILLGPATRITEFILHSPKAYRAQVYLGRATDTGDAEGQVITEHPISGITESQVEDALGEFRGHILQVPPVYSALKREGQPLYALARRGVEVELKPREVKIYRLEILNWQPPLLDLEIECSAGTYIRALARDLGEKLGCGAHLAALIRTRIGRFPIEEAISLEEIEAPIAESVWRDWLHPLDEALLDIEPVMLGKESEDKIEKGRAVDGREWVVSLKMDRVRAYSASGKFMAILRRTDKGQWQPDKVFL